MRKTFVICFLMICISVSFSSCLKAANDPISKTEFLLGTICSVKIYDRSDKSILEKVFDEIKRIESMISTSIKSSEISEINRNSGIKAVEVSLEVLGLIKRGLEFSVISGGIFNIAIGPLVDLWGIGTPDARVPLPEEIEETIPLLDYRDVEIDEAKRLVFLKKTGMSLDLGGIAKGYIADRIEQVLWDNGVSSAIVNLGGNVYAHGSKNGNEEWKIGIQDPFSQRNQYFAIYRTKNESIVSSGVYERFFEQDGVVYHHIFDSTTGYPVVTKLQSVTITGQNSETADALSTIVFSLGIEKGSEFLEGFPDYEAIFVDEDKKIYLTQKMMDLTEITNESYQVEIYD